MAGIIGYICKKPHTGYVQRALEKIRYGAMDQIEEFSMGNGVLTGYISRHHQHISEYKCPTDQSQVIVYGLVLSRQYSVWHRLDAEQILSGYRKSGIDYLTQLDGAFAIQIYDQRNRKLIVQSDPTGSCPIFSCESNNRFGVGPEASAVLDLVGMNAKISSDGVVGFLLNGYPVGSHTMFENVTRHQPGTIFTYDSETICSECVRYYDLEYLENDQHSQVSTVEALYGSLLESVQAFKTEESVERHLALTGGYDSRTLLGFMQKCSLPPKSTFTWGAVGNLKNSDPVIARKLSETTEIAHSYRKYSAADFSRNAKKWAVRSDMLSDNMGHFSAGESFLSFSPESVVFLGDHILGNSGYPENENEAIQQVTGIDISRTSELLGCLMPDTQADEMIHRYGQQIKEIINQCNSDHPKNLQHYLEFRLGVFGWLMAPGYYKEPIYQARRPMLLKPMLEFACHSSPENRIGKNLLIKMLREKFPELMKQPKSSVFSLINWRRSLNEMSDFQIFLTDNLNNGLNAGIPYLDSINHSQVTADIQAMISLPVSEKKRTLPGADKLLRFRDGIMKHPLGRTINNRISKSRKGKSGPGKMKLYQRIALLGMFQELINNSR